MVDEAVAHGLRISQTLRKHLVDGKKIDGANEQFTKPAPDVRIHDSMNKAWRIVEWIPKPKKYQDIAREARLNCGWYLPRAEPRYIVSGAFIHWSVIERMEMLQKDYAPINLPDVYRVVK